jgi:hypothetical protein
MKEEDLELLITLDDPGEDELGEDTFHLQDEAPMSRSLNGGETSGEQKSLLIMAPEDRNG